MPKTDQPWEQWYTVENEHFHAHQRDTKSTWWVGAASFSVALAKATVCQARYGGFWGVVPCRNTKCVGELRHVSPLKKG